MTIAAALRCARDRFAAGIVAITVLFLIAADIVRAAGWSWDDFAASVARLVPPAGAEVHNYVEFVTVAANVGEVVTGIRFESSLNGRITAQWCYFRPSRPEGGAEMILTLAETHGAAASSSNAFAPAALAAAGLTGIAAQELRQSHCRFR